jgi:hypothetical protein
VIKKPLFTAVLLSILLWSCILGTRLVEITKANFIVVDDSTFYEPPIVTIESPLNNETFSLNNVLLVFTLTKPEGGIYYDSVWATISWGDYSKKDVYVNIALDGKTYTSIEANSYPWSPFNSSLNLTNLEDGVHSVQVHALCVTLEPLPGYPWPLSYLFNTSSNIVYFTVDTTPPAIAVMPVENKTDGSFDIPLNFTLNEPTSQIKYSLDGQANVTIAGNTTLLNLPYGQHNVTVYATDIAGNIGSETINFTIAEPPEPFPTTLVIAPIASAAVIGLGLLVCFRKRNH